MNKTLSLKPFKENIVLLYKTNQMPPSRQRCCLCKKYFVGYGNNPAPICRKGRCCDTCNWAVVMARIKASQMFNQ